MNKKIFFIFLFFLLGTNVFSQNKIDDSNLYFSFKKVNSSYLVSVEGYLVIERKKMNLNDLVYEWKIDLGDNYEKIKTYRPYFVIEDLKENFSGILTISGRSSDFNFEKFFTFVNKNKPRVTIVKYNQKYNLALPLTKLNNDEVLYPLTYNFSSNNLSYVWIVNNAQYYNSFLLDIGSLSGKIEITLQVTNLDNPNEIAIDKVIIQK